jgi:hypothetical protein
MNGDSDAIAFLAHVIVTGRTNITAEEKTRLEELAGSHLKVGDRVTISSVVGSPTLDPGQTLAGTIEEIRRTRARVRLDEPIEIPGADYTIRTTEVIAELARLQREPPAPAPTA